MPARQLITCPPGKGPHTLENSNAPANKSATAFCIIEHKIKTQAWPQQSERSPSTGLHAERLYHQRTVNSTVGMKMFHSGTFEQWTRLGPRILSLVERLSSFGVSFIGGFTVPEVFYIHAINLLYHALPVRTLLAPTSCSPGRVDGVT